MAGKNGVGELSTGAAVLAAEGQRGLSSVSGAVIVESLQKSW